MNRAERRRGADPAIITKVFTRRKTQHLQSLPTISIPRLLVRQETPGMGALRAAKPDVGLCPFGASIAGTAIGSAGPPHEPRWFVQ